MVNSKSSPFFQRGGLRVSGGWGSSRFEFTTCPTTLALAYSVCLIQEIDLCLFWFKNPSLPTGRTPLWKKGEIFLFIYYSLNAFPVCEQPAPKWKTPFKRGLIYVHSGWRTPPPLTRGLPFEKKGRYSLFTICCLLFTLQNKTVTSNENKVKVKVKVKIPWRVTSDKWIVNSEWWIKNPPLFFKGEVSA